MASGSQRVTNHPSELLSGELLLQTERVRFPQHTSNSGKKDSSTYCGCASNIREIVPKPPKGINNADLQGFTYLDASHVLSFLKEVTWKSDFSYLGICALLRLIYPQPTSWSDMWTPWWDASVTTFDAGTEVPLRLLAWDAGTPPPNQGNTEPGAVPLPHSSHPLTGGPTWAWSPPEKGFPPSSTIHYFWAQNIKIKHF